MTSSPFGNIFDKLKSSTKQAADQMKLAGKIAGLKVERSTQKAERERLLKEIGSKTFSVFSKTNSLDPEALEEEITNELKHIERIDKRMIEIEQEISELQQELVKSGGKVEIVEAEDVSDDDEDEEEEEEDEDEEVSAKKKKKK
jgi:transposase